MSDVTPSPDESKSPKTFLQGDTLSPPQKHDLEQYFQSLFRRKYERFKRGAVLIVAALGVVGWATIPDYLANKARDIAASKVEESKELTKALADSLVSVQSEAFKKLKEAESQADAAGQRATKLTAKLEEQAVRADISQAYVQARTEVFERQIDQLQNSLAEAGPKEIAKALVELPEVKASLTQAFSSLPVGSILAFPGEVSADRFPKGDWMPCDGRELSAGEYGTLYIVLGRKAVNPATGSFRLPDYRGYFLRGVGTVVPSDDAAKRTFLEVANENRAGSGVGSTQSWGTGPPDDAEKLMVPSYTSVNAGNHPLEKGSFWIGGKRHNFANETRPVNVYVHWIIKVK